MKTFYAQICFCCFLALTALTGMADNTPIKPEGKGTKDSPYLISCIENLVWMQEQVETFTHEYFKMTADIDASETRSWNSGKGFKPIGEARDLKSKRTTKKEYRKKHSRWQIMYHDVAKKPFRGHFDGNGHIIKKLYINRNEEEYGGLFGCVGYFAVIAETDGKMENLLSLTNDVDRSYIKNLQLLDVDFRNSRQMAGLVGITGNTDIENCLVTGTIKADETTCGLAVIMDQCLVRCCGVNVDFDNKCSDLAGLANCLNQCLVEDFFCSGRCKTSDDSDYNYIFGLYNICKVGYFKNCLVTTKHSGSQAWTRGLTYLSVNEMSPTIENCFFSRNNLADNTDTNRGLTNEALKKSTTFKGWDFEKVWSIEEGVSFPTLRFPWLEKKSDSTLKKASGGLSKSTVKSGAKKQIRKAGTSTSAKKAPAKKSADTL